MTANVYFYKNITGLYAEYLVLITKENIERNFKELDNINCTGLPTAP